MRIVMMGTGPFAVPTFRALLDSPKHEVPVLVTQPLRPTRGAAPPAPMRELAIERGVAIYDPESINTPESIDAMRCYTPDVLVVADYGQILSPELLATAKHGGVNLHGSLLPKYRGAAPINWAIYHGETITGVSVIQMSPRVDSGAVLAQASTPIGEDEGAIALERRLADLGAGLVLDVLDRLERGVVEPIPQDPALVTRARRLRKSDGEIDWTRPARAIYNQTRAFEPWPNTFSHWRRASGDAQPLRVIFGAVRPIDQPTDKPPGEVVEASKGLLTVATGEGLLAIERLQPAGKRMLSADEFMRGYAIAPGDRFGPA